jgi:acetyl-CoA acyltransferase
MEAVIVDAVRTPFGRNRGGLSGIRTDDLAALPIRELLARHPELDPADIDEIVLGDTNQAGEDNRNVARMAALLAGLPLTVTGVTVNRLCGSGGEAVIQAGRLVRTGDGAVAIAGGVEGMSRAPFVLQRPDEALPRDMPLHSTTVGWRMVNPAMPEEWLLSLGASAEQTGVRLGITREEMDAWALRSHRRAHAAWEAGLHDDAVMEVAGVRRDESIRPDTTAEALAGLKPAFTRDGVVTAGNSSPINDGALAMLLASDAEAARRGWPALARLGASATVGVAPQDFGYAPVPAIRALLERSGLGVADIDLWEIQEAFAAVPLTVLREIDGIDPERVNVHGGAIAYGHPLGASAPRLILDCVRELRRRGGGTGLVAVCIGVGQGQALLVHVDA